MNALNRKTRNLLETAARRLRPHLGELSQRWKQSYQQVYPEETETIIRRLDQLNVGMLADCLERRDIKACFERINYHGRRLAKLGLPQEKIAASLKIYLQTARALLRTHYPKLGETEAIVSAIEQLHLIEMMITHESYSHIKSEVSEAMISIMDAQLATEEIDQFLWQLLRLSVEAMQANGGQLLLIDEKQPEQIRLTLDTDRRSTHTKPVSVKGVAHAVLQNGEPIFVHTAPTRTRTRRAQSLWAFPIKIKQQPIGALILRFAKHYECLPKEREMLEGLLKRAALALERILLLERIRANEQRIRELSADIMITQDEERRRISRELHDETGHSLLVIKLYLEMIYKELPRTLAATRKKTKEAITLVEKTLKELRRLISDLGPVLLDDLGLVGALRWYAKTMLDLFNIKVLLKVNRNFPRLPKNLEVAIYRIVQEALNNAARHSRASEVTVSLQEEHQSVNIHVTDNGIGFKPARLAELKCKRSFGLLGMQERISLLGGNFTIESSPRQGTQIRVSLPLVIR
ncbi:MAG: GAF domain-containing sensor histidine kinase [Acidobacteriota bacterium]